MPAPATNVVPLRPDRDRQELVERLREADPAAITAVYRLHHAEVRAFARRMLGDVGAAEDVVHDVFVALPDAAARFRGEASIRTLLMSIAVNRCRRWVRGTVRRRAAMTRFGDEPVRSESTTPEAELDRRQLAERLRVALEALPVEQREVFVLCTVEERTSPEVGVILDIPEATVRTRLFHARRKLREMLEPGAEP